MTQSNSLITILVLVLGFGYWYFFWSPGEEVPLTASEEVGVAAKQRFVDLGTRLNGVRLDKSIFNDPRFLSLESIATPIQPEDLGRTDPFAPI